MFTFTESQKQSFWNRVSNKQRPDDCHLWLGWKDSSGYGGFDFAGKMYKAHRVVWVLTYGEIPNELQVLHKCDVRNCVNPLHLFLGTNADNVADKVNKNRQHRNYDRHYNTGEIHGKAKLKEEDVRQIRTLLAEGMDCRQLAVAYGLSYEGVQAIKHRRTWKHVL